MTDGNINRVVELGETAEFVRGINFKPNDVVELEMPGVVACMRTKNVQAELDCNDVWGVADRFVKRPEQYLSAGDILVSSANSWNLVGKCCPVPDLPWRATFGGFVSVLRPDSSKVDARYLYRWFSSERVQTTLRSFGQQTTNISNLNIERCLKLKMPLPTLDSQRRIVAILDTADELRAKRRAAVHHLNMATEATFFDLFGDPATNSKQWPETKSLGDVAHIVSGVTKGRDLQGKSAREVPYLAVVNVQDRSLNLSTIKKIRATEEEIQQFKLMQNDLLLTEGGDPDKLGRGTLWNDEISECIHQNHVFRVRLKTDDLQPLFLNWLIGSQRGKRYFLRSAKQTTGIASINMTQLRGFPLILPPLALQAEFSRRVGIVEKLRAAHRESLAKLDALFASLQHRAFRGEL